MSGRSRLELGLVLGCAAGAALLAASQFTNLFELTPPGEDALGSVAASDQHGWVTLVLAVLALALLATAISAAGEAVAQGAAFAVAVCGMVALLIFLLIDLPDAGTIGALDEDTFLDAEAEPAAGFWLELAGALVLTGFGVALAASRPGRAEMTARTGGPEPSGLEPPGG